MRRGEVWWARLGPPYDHRPVVLLSRNEAYGSREIVLVSPVTTRIRGIPSEVALGPQEGLRRPSVANLDVITTAPKIDLEQRAGELGPDKLMELEAAVHFAWGLAT